MALAAAHRPDEQRQAAVGIQAQARVFVGETRASFDIIGHADAAQPAAFFRLGAARLECAPFCALHRRIHEAREITRIIGQVARRVVGHGLGRDEVAPADLVWAKPQLAGRRVDEALDQVGRFRPPGTAIGIDRHRVGVDALDLRVKGRKAVGAGKHRGAGTGRDVRRELRQIGAHVGLGGDPQPQQMSVAVQRQFRRRDMVAPVGVGNEALGALAGPLDRAAQAAGGVKHQDMLGIKEEPRAEPTPHVGRDHAEPLRRQLKDMLGQDAPEHVDALRVRGQRELSAIRAVVPEGRARLHGVHHDTVVDQLEAGHVGGLLERGGGRGRIAHFPVERDVVLCVRPDLRRSGVTGGGQRDHGGQFLVIHVDQLRGVARLGEGIGNHHRHRLAHVAGPVQRQDGARRHHGWAPVLVFARCGAGQGPDPVGGQVGAAVDGEDPRRVARRGGVDAAQRRVGEGAADHHGMGLTRQVDIVAVAASAGEEAFVLHPVQTLTDAESRHGVFR